MSTLEYEVADPKAAPVDNNLSDIEKELKEGLIIHSQKSIIGGFDVSGLNDKKIAEIREQLKCTEALGGLAGFEKWLKDTNCGKNSLQSPLVQDMAVSIPRAIGQGTRNARHAVNVNLMFGAVYFTLSVDVMNTPISGKGTGWGIGLGYIGAMGMIEVTGLLSQLAKVDSFYTFGGSAGAGAGGISFSGNGTPIAAIIFGGAGVGGGVGGGGFTFYGA
ncbi:hypothetical protein CPB84DRAFT_1854079 [Gymnopilus junonius]|uniref:Uncharacterized protein n=1 Tax=Gymnopilus junonius TaxID=109634 RepID=A0A9P5TG24_GYMJU|nr:hypothetical protein CPB84DRAFT_1854079 [Gymnopilus junonius]